MSAASKASRFKIYSPFLMPLLFLLLAGGGIWITVKWVSGMSSSNPHKGKIAVPSTRTDIPAYTKISREHLGVIHLDPKRMPENVLTDVKDVLGRILSRDKKAGYVFTGDDFLAKGTRPGIVGGIPPGKRAFTIETDKVQGLYGLQAGDQFDLMGIFKLNPKSNLQVVGNVSSIADSVAEPSVIVRRGTVVIPLRTRDVPYTQTSLTRGMQVRTRPVRESVIAVDPSEVDGLAQAFSMQAELYVISLSGQPSSSEENTGENKKPEPLSSGLKVVETLKGNQRSRVAVPS